MKNSTFGLIVTAISLLSPVTAFAQDSQTVIQSNTNSAAAVGTGNFINQGTVQNSQQTQFDVNGYLTGSPSGQAAVQVNSNEAAAIGTGNFINQQTLQNSGQTNVDVNGYLQYLPY